MFERYSQSESQVEQLIYYLLVILISTFLLKIFWNNGMVPFITILKPIKTMQEALMLSLGLMIVKGRVM